MSGRGNADNVVALDMDARAVSNFEEALDPLTIEWLSDIDIAAGSRVAEVGTGSLAIDVWLSKKVGEKGSVFVASASGRSNSGTGLKNLKVQKVDLEKGAICSAGMDLVVARTTLMNAERPLVVLENIWDSLREGGYLAIEEFDCSGVSQAPGCQDSIELVERWKAGFTPDDMRVTPDLLYGGRLVSDLDAAGFDILRREIRQQLSKGGDAMAGFWSETVPSVQAELADTLDPEVYGGLASILKDNSQRLGELLGDPSVAFYDAFRVFVLAQKPKASA